MTREVFELTKLEAQAKGRLCLSRLPQLHCVCNMPLILTTGLSVRDACFIKPSSRSTRDIRFSLLSIGDITQLRESEEIHLEGKSAQDTRRTFER